MFSERDIYDLFEGVKKRNAPNSWQAKCPCHNDKQASLTITNDEAKGKTLLRCHAGCKTGDILAAVGKTFADINGNKSEPKKPQPKWQKNLKARYDYFAPYSKEYLYSKLKYPDKDGSKNVPYAIIDGEQIQWNKGSIEPVLYNINAMLESRSDFVCITEGEKDANTLTKLGYVAVTAGGAGDWKSKYAEFFKGKLVTIFRDNDEAGEKVANQISNDIRNYAYKRRIINPCPHIEGGDITDLLEPLPNKKDVLYELLNGKSAEKYLLADWVYLSGNNNTEKVNADTLASTFTSHNNIIIAKSQAYENETIFQYTDGVYNAVSTSEIQRRVRAYLPIGKATPAIMNDTAKLIITNSKCIAHEDFDSDESIINLKNGIYDLKTHTLKKHSPHYLSTIQLNVDYDEKARCPKWLKYVTDLCSDEEGVLDEEMLAVLQEFTGVIVSNVNCGRKLKGCLIIYSPESNSGKSVYIDVMRHLVGESNCSAVSFQELGGERSHFTKADLFGKRLNAVGDQDKAVMVSSQTFKELTGADWVRAEVKHKQGFDFKFKGVLLVACNDVPKFENDKSDAVMNRLNILQCRHIVKPEEVNITLADELYEEAAGIFNWGLEGLKRLQRNNYRLTPCKSAGKAKDEYRSNIDHLYKFIELNCERGEGESYYIRKSEFYRKYDHWCLDKGYAAINLDNLDVRMRQQKIPLRDHSNVKKYKGIKWTE